jgi:hypothetical protein
LYTLYLNFLSKLARHDTKLIDSVKKQQKLTCLEKKYFFDQKIKALAHSENLKSAKYLIFSHFELHSKIQKFIEIL